MTFKKTRDKRRQRVMKQLTRSCASIPPSARAREGDGERKEERHMQDAIAQSGHFSIPSKTRAPKLTRGNIIMNEIASGASSG